MFTMIDTIGHRPLEGFKQLALGSHFSHARRPRNGPVAPRAQQK